MIIVAEKSNQRSDTYCLITDLLPGYSVLQEKKLFVI